MRKTIPLLLIAALVLSSCGRLRDTRLNPFNWFGRAESRQLEEGEVRNPLLPRRSILADPKKADLRPRVQQVTGLVIERLPSGAIVRAEGVTAYQGAYEVDLRRVEDAELPAERLIFEFVARQPRGAVGTQPSRTVVAAVELSNQDLLTVRTIEVLGAANALTARR